jgi:type IV pilus assembly protein PilQ
MRTGKALRGLAWTVGLLVVALGAAPATAQESTAMTQVGMTRTGAGTFTIDVTGADIRTVTRAISEFSGRNIVVGKDVKAQVSIALRNVGWEEALRTVCRSTGLDYAWEGGILRVDEANKLNQEAVERETARARAMELAPLETRVVKLNFANAPEMTAPLQAALTKRGQVQVERRTNSLIITDLPENVAKVEQMAIALDSTTPQVEITAKLVDVDVEALHQIGIEWNVSPAETEFFGPTEGTTGGQPPVPFNPFDETAAILGANQNTGIADPANRLTFGLFKDWITLEAQLQTLAQNRKANIISNPRITTVDNREAKILVGQKIPLIVQDVAGNPVTQLQTIGIQLRVTPHLTDDKKIIMDLHPEVSDLSTQSTVQGGVIINTSEADTRVMVEDGQTAVIGGLIRSNDSVVRRGVPYLMDIPLVGMLFRSDSKTRQNRELIIFVTPRLIQSMASN